MGKQSAPPPPDYAAAATAQGAANVAAAQDTAALNRPNQVDSNGSQTWSLKPGADPKNPQAGDWTVTTALNSTQQALKDQQDALSSQYGGLASGALGAIGNTMSTKFDTSGLPQASQLSNSGLGSYQQVAAPTMGQMAPGVPTNLQGVSTQGLSQYGSVPQGSQQSRDQVQNALYARSTAMLDPQTQQAQSDLTSQLAAQGITAGSDAYNRAMDNQARQTSQSYENARNDAITAGGAEDSRIYNQNLSSAQLADQTRQQQLNEQTTVAGFNNNNTQNTFQNGLAAAGFNNGVTSNNFSQGLQAAQANNATRGAEFGEQQAMVNTNNTLHNNAVTEALQQRELPLNEANALRSGNQVGGTNFQAYGGAGQVAAAPVYQSTSDAYNAQVAATNAANASNAGIWGGLTKLGSSAISAY